MPRYARNEGYIGLAKQTAKGTGVAPAFFVRWNGAKMTPERGEEFFRDGATDQYPGFGRPREYKPDGSFSLFARPDIAGFLLTMLLGSDTVSGTGPYTHTIVPGSRTAQPWLSIEESVAGQLLRRITDARIKSIEIKSQANEPVELNIEYLGTTETIPAAATPTYETEDPFVFWQGAYTLDGGAITAVVDQFSIKLANIFDEDDYTTDIVRSDIPLFGREATASWRMRFEDASRFRAAYYGNTTGTSPAKTLLQGSLDVNLTYGTGAGARQLRVTLPALLHTAAAVELDAKDEKAQAYECEGTAIKASGQNFVTVIVQNNRSTAY